jgi:signal transduction histidine kinase
VALAGQTIPSQHPMPKTPAVSSAEETAHRIYLDRHCDRAMVVGVIIYALDALEPWLDFHHDVRAVQIQLGVAAAIAVTFLFSSFGWGKKHKLAIVTFGLLLGALGFESIVYKEGAFNSTYSVGFPVLFAYYAVLLPVTTRTAVKIGILLLLLDALPGTIHQPDYHVILQSVVSNFTAFAIILYARISLNGLWHREFIAREQITNFVSNISHECVSPSVALSLDATQLCENKVAAGDLTTRFAEMQELSHRVTRNLRSLIAFGRLEEGRQPFNPVVANPRDLVEDAIKTFKRDPLSQGKDVVLEIANELPFVSADYDSMQMVLLNLLDNARKYSPGSPAIRVRVSPSKRFVWRPRFVNISIEDHGIGIPPSDLRKIYTKFVRGDHATKHQIGGVGIGLSIVRQVLLLHRAKMMVQTEVNKGTTFTVILRTIR